jgi:hypothetical protein
MAVKSILMSSVYPYPYLPCRQVHLGKANNVYGFGTLQIQWLSDDVEDPQNFRVGFKWTITAVNAGVTLAVALASSTYAGAALDIAFAFRERNEEIVILGTSLMPSLSSMLINLTHLNAGISLFVFGFAFGPLVWGPLSEIYGRRWILIVSHR